MDFTLALTHFCEAHGPKSVLCTQVLPLECAMCLPPSPPLRPSTSSSSLNTQVHGSSFERSASNLRRIPPSLRKTDTNSTLPTDFSGASTTVDSETEAESPTIEKHPLFTPVDQKRELGSQWRYGRSQGETCASCSFSVPKAIAEKLPAGAPGSKRSDGKPTTNTGAPVLRSREFVCLREKKRRTSSINHHRRPFDSKPSSYGSSLTSSACSHTPSHPHSHSDECHDHTLTYLTAKSPDDPESYAQLRASVIRTLSCELLPRGMSDGPFCFGDSSTGYTIAYVFRLTDPKARGRRRAYAFVALAGKNASRAFQACPMLWEAFASMAKGIETAAQRHQERQRQKDQKEAESLDANKSARNYTPVSSFLTARMVDPDGNPRRVGHATPRSLAEIVGDENIFTFLHQYFVAILRCLGDQFGGLPLIERPSVYQSVSEEAEGFNKTESVRHEEPRDVDSRHLERLRDDDATPKPTLLSKAQSKTWPQQALQNRANDTQKQDERERPADKIEVGDDMERVKSRANKAFTRTLEKHALNPQCARPLTVNETAQRQVVV